MALGICLICDRLVTIRPAGFKWAGDRQREWFPIFHDGNDGKPCPGTKKGI